MNCERFQTVVSDLVRDQIMEANDRASALAHVAECHSCAAKWEDERYLSGGLRELAKSMESLSAPPQLEARVLAAFRERSTVLPTVRPAYLQPRYWFAAIAAALLIAFGIFVVRGRVFTRSQPQIANPGIQKPNDLPNVPPRIVQDAVAKKAEAPIPVRRTPRRNANNSVALRPPSSAGKGKNTNAAANAVVETKNNSENGAVASEVTTDFYPISYGTSLNLQDGGQLFRVELPRSAVARFGLPVNIDRGSERVKADVLVGADGLAQAIRFVH